MDEKTCSKCRWFDLEDGQEPCSKCRNTVVPSSAEYQTKPFLWESKEDIINHPAHYETGKYECIDVMCEAIGLENVKGFCLCNAFKYIYRCTKKHDDTTEDVKKAIWYLNKFIELETDN